MATAALPLFHLYGDPPDDQAFDFIHIETIASRSSIHDWTIRAHRHRNLFQILLIEQRRRRDDVRSRHRCVRSAVRDPGAGNGRPWLSLPSGGHRRLGDDLHRGRRRGDGRSPRRGACAPQGARGRSGRAARGGRARTAVEARRRAQRGSVSGTRRLSHRHARTAGADRGRGRASRRQPVARRRRSRSSRPARPSRRCASWWRSISRRSGSSRSMPTSSR